jgi:hypothetical protein
MMRDSGVRGGPLLRSLPFNTCVAVHGCIAGVIREMSVRVKVALMGKLWIGETNGCWIDVWDKPGFSGHHRRLWGPADFPYMRIAEANWNPQVQSLQAGPNAYLQFYEDLNFHDSVFWVLPNQRVDDVTQLSCNDEIDSLRIYDRPPFAHEPGYAAYMLWAASHLTRASKTE